MKEIRNITTVTYELNNGFRCDVVITPDMIEAWFYHDGYGIKSYLFGMNKKDTSLDEVVSIINECAEEYMDNYSNEFMDIPVIYERCKLED